MTLVGSQLYARTHARAAAFQAMSEAEQARVRGKEEVSWLHAERV